MSKLSSSTLGNNVLFYHFNFVKNILNAPFIIQLTSDADTCFKTAKELTHLTHSII